MILTALISAALLAVLPFALLAGKRKVKQQATATGPQPDIEAVIHQLFIDKKQQQLVPEQIVRPVLAKGDATMYIVEERVEFGGNNEWLHAGIDEIRKAAVCADILKRPACAN